MLPIISNMIEAHIFRMKKGKIEFLLLKRSEKEIYPGLWQMVSGSIHDGETAYQTALREILEETNLKPKMMWVVPNVNSFYSPEKNYVSLLPVFAVKVDPNSKVRISNEHTEYKWVTYDEAVQQIHWPDQIESLNVIWRYLSSEKLKNKLVELDI